MFSSIVIIIFVIESKATSINDIVFAERKRIRILQYLQEKKKYHVTNKQKYRVTVVKKSKTIILSVFQGVARNKVM